MNRVVEEFSTDRIVGMVNNKDGLFKLRRHCIKLGGCREDVIATGKCTIVEPDVLGMGWLQGVYGPLPNRRPDFLAIVEYTGTHDGVMLIPLDDCGEPYVTECYDDVYEEEYCVWTDTKSMTYEDVMKYVNSDNLIALYVDTREE